MPKAGASALLLMLAAPGMAQTTPTPPAPPAPPVPIAVPAPPAPPAGGPPPEFIQTAQAFGQCIEANARTADASLTPEAAADAVLVACRTEQTKLETGFEAWVSSPSFPAEGREIARAELRNGLAQGRVQLAEGIRRARATPPAPAPTPTP